jgi:hypothetical protein
MNPINSTNPTNPINFIASQLPSLAPSAFYLQPFTFPPRVNSRFDNHIKGSTIRNTCI